MSFEDEIFSTLMPDTVTIYAPTNTNGYGQRTFSSTGVVVRGRLSYTTNRKLNMAGQTIVDVGKFYCRGVPTVTANYKLVLNTGLEATVLSVDPVGDEDGDHHTVITFGSAASGGA